ncbi:unnamed protein product [Caenorhabditis sp. 36 PRJEB53466]|nr:unnamed protein product [Caenorhabditis sp. 36 PRJEB53466]
MLFPLIAETATQQLTDTINIQSTLEDGIEVLNEWIDKNWVDLITTTTRKPTTNTKLTTTSGVYYGRLAEKEYARNLSTTYLEQREMIKLYVRYLFRTTQILGYFNEEQATEMRTMFWSADKLCDNYFSCCEGDFFTEMGKKFKNVHRNVSSDVRVLANVVHQFAGIGDKLDWRFVKY